MSKSYDLIIVGGGLVGNSLAVMLAEQGWRIAVIETKDLHAATSFRDNRSIVLTYTSYQILNALGLWTALAAQSFPIKKIHVSHAGSFGTARFVPEQIGVPLFGYVVPGDLLTQVLQQAVLNLAATKKIDLICPAKIQKISPTFANTNDVEINVENETRILNTQLIVAADGTQSSVRELLQIPIKKYDYQQTAIITTIEVTRDHQQGAYERLTSSGPLAILPRMPFHCGVVWTVDTNASNEILSMSDNQFLEKLQQAFGYRLGKLKNVTARSSYPLRIMQAEQQIRPGIVLLGNAAHTLHPVAGQGFNLGLRDAAALAETLIEGKALQQPLGKFSLLDSYVRWRETDQKNIIRFTDRTVRIFSQEFLPLKNVGLLSINLLPFLKRRLTRKLLGFNGRAPKLACAVPLGLQDHE